MKKREETEKTKKQKQKAEEVKEESESSEDESDESESEEDDDDEVRIFPNLRQFLKARTFLYKIKFFSVKVKLFGTFSQIDLLLATTILKSVY